MPILTARERINTEIGGRYRAKRIIGEGAFGAVFAAEHTLTAREVALKILHPHLVQTEQIAQRFLLEAQTMAKIRHPGICQILDAGREQDGTIFLALELLEGETLEECLERKGKLPRPEALRIAVEMLDALAAAHAREIVHRDIKPANIYLNRENDGMSHAKLLDFGIAHVAPKGGNKLTDAGVVLGTPEYMPPEQARGRHIGPVSDVWAAGIVLYEMLSGMVPWSGESAAGVLIAVANTPLTDIRELVPDTPPALADVINRALEKDSTLRFRTAEEMRDAIIEAADAEGISLSLLGVRQSIVGGSGEWKAVRLPGAPVAPAATAAPAQTPPRRHGGNIELELPEGSDIPSLMISLDAFAPPPPDSGSLPVPPPPTPVEPQDVQRPLINAGAPDPQRPPSIRPPPVNHEPRATKSVGAMGAISADATAPPRTQSNAKLSIHPPPNTSGSMPRSEAAPVANTGPTFQTIQQTRSSAPLVIAALVGVSALATAAYFVMSHPATGGGSTLQSQDADTAHDGGEGEEDAQVAATRVRLRSVGAVPIPFALRGEDARVFVRHLTMGPPRANRMVGTCAAGNVRLFNTQNGLPVTETAAPIACNGFDLTLVGDLDGDGNDDVAAINAQKSAVLILSTQASPARTMQTVALPGVVGLAGGIIEAQGRTLVVAITEPRVSEPSELVAIDVRSGAIAWRRRGRNGLDRIGHPTDLGLTIGPDADDDGVNDVVAGAGPLTNTPPDRMPELPRCAELLSGASGRTLWAQPFCQRRGGVQSVSLGPDVDGDRRADVAIATDVTRGSEPRVVIVSGATGGLLRRIPTPEGPSAQGFGWPVSLGPDTNGDAVPDLAVGSVSSSSTYVSLVSARDGAVLASQALDGAAGFPNLRLLVATGVWRGVESAALVIASPADGLKVFALSPDGR
jgi:serine/threonine protein kinase